VVSGDDEMLCRLRDSLPYRLMLVGSGADMDYTAYDMESDGASHITCKVKTPVAQFQADIPALGGHMIYPTLMAAAVAEHFGMGADEITQGIRAFLPTKMRMNVVRCAGDIVILNDAYNANPQSMRAAAAVLGDAKGRRRVAVVGDMKELGPNSELFHRAVGGYFAEQGVERLIAVGDHARFMAEGADEKGLHQVSYFETIDDAKPSLLRELRSGTTILVKASRSMAFEKIVNFLLENVEQ
jgi:UDP-N-acetylmuramoyl-tripeptide--D-alanyl-D-alanine ligase